METIAFVRESKRLRLRALLLSDLDFVAEMLAHSEVMQFWPRTYSRDEAAHWIKRHHKRYEDDGYGYWHVSLRDTGEPVGQAGLLKQEFDGRTAVGLGYILHRPFWGLGLAQEAAERCLAYGIDELGLSEIAVLIRPENEPSIRLAERLGAQLESETDYAGFRHRVYWIRRHLER